MSIAKPACAYRSMSSASNSSSNSSTFPSNSANLIEAHIELDHQIYNPGDVVSGQLLLVLDKPLTADRITARLFGSARVFFTEILKTPGPNFGKNRAFEQEQILADQQTEIWTALGEEGLNGKNGGIPPKKKPIAQKSLEEVLRLSNPNAIRIGQNQRQCSVENGPSSKSMPASPCGLPIGRHQFHFAFKLPIDGLFTSFDARHSAGSIRYHILVQAFNGAHCCLRRKLLFPVVCPKRLDEPNWMGMALEPVLENGSDKKDQLKVELSMEKCGFVPGEPLCGTIKIENNTGKSVKSMSLRILQRTTCYASRPEFAVHQSEFETSAMGLPMPKISHSQCLSFPIRFNVPALVPEICLAGCIESEHKLCLDVANKRGVTVELRTPLLIGTHPTPQRRYPAMRQDSIATTNLLEDVKVVASEEFDGPPPPMEFGAPPSYEEMAQNVPSGNGNAQQIMPFENVPPPSYAQSVAGLSEINSNGQSASRNEGTADENGGYAGPICYHYNFGYAPDTAEECQEENSNGSGTIRRRQQMVLMNPNG